MNDRKVLQEVVDGTVNIEELQSRILDVFMGEIQAEVVKGTPVDTGYMRQHWHERRIGTKQIEFSNNTAYLPFHITGTGLYGPRHQMICAKGMSKKNPRHLHVMAWKPRGGGDTIFRRCTRGIRPNPFIENGIEAGIANACEAVMQMFRSADHVIQ
ncbi:MAG: HK97 gp10 family phage protein [Methanoregula sp.]|nr:HK97 gp10 family phage protein [Methanoregula sp.]